jgi:hypothetical protein
MKPPRFMFGMCHTSCGSYVTYYVPLLPCFTMETGDEGDEAERGVPVEG